MARTPQEVFEHHGTVLVAGDIDGIVEDYSDDAIIITPGGVLRGKDGVRTAFETLLGDLPNAAWEIPTQIFEEDILFITWSARSEKTQVRDAVDTFVFRDGLIRVQTVQYAVEPVAG
jgi:ketosteroid isomerase-like protein